MSCRYVRRTFESSTLVAATLYCNWVNISSFTAPVEVHLLTDGSHASLTHALTHTMRLSLCIVLIGFGVVVALILALLKSCYKRIKVFFAKRNNRLEARPHVMAPTRCLTLGTIDVSGQSRAQTNTEPPMPPAYSESTAVQDLPPPPYSDPLPSAGSFSDPPPSYREAVAQKAAQETGKDDSNQQ